MQMPLWAFPTIRRKTYPMPKMTGSINDYLTRAIVFTATCLMVTTAAAFPANAAKYNRETPVVKAVREISPAVVNISTETVERQQVNPFWGRDPFFDQFFRDFFESSPQREYRRTSLGSGVIIDGNRGFILTNAHVISQASTITIVLQDEREFDAQVVGADPDSDLAVLRIRPETPLPAVSMGSSADLMIGESVIAIGNPFGFSHTVTTGVISAVNRSIRSGERIFQDFIQIDASINPGNSGGPLLNINGELIGINTAIYAQAQGIGFAIPIDTARRIVDDLIAYGEVIQAWIGVVIQELNPNLAAYHQVPGQGGVVVRDVVDGSPARSAGIVSGDIILSLNGKPVTSEAAYEAATRGITAGNTVPVTLWRKGRLEKQRLRTMAFPEHRALDLAKTLLGVNVTDIDKSLRRQFRLVAEAGVVITGIHPRSELARTGVQPGDVIRQIDDLAISDIADFKKAIAKYRRKKSLVILVQRGRQGYYVTVRM